MSSLLSIAFSKHQVTEYSVTHACPVGTHEDASVAKDSFHRSRNCWNTIHGGHKSTQRLELLIALSLSLSLSPSVALLLPVPLSLPLSIFMANFPGEPGLAGFIEAENDGGDGDNWSYKTCKAPVKSS